LKKHNEKLYGNLSPQSIFRKIQNTIFVGNSIGLNYNIYHGIMDPLKIKESKRFNEL